MTATGVWVEEGLGQGVVVVVVEAAVVAVVVAVDVVMMVVVWVPETPGEPPVCSAGLATEDETAGTFEGEGELDGGGEAPSRVTWGPVHVWATALAGPLWIGLQPGNWSSQPVMVSSTTGAIEQALISSWV